jgi:enterochelin esterase-like enzyme
MRCSTLPLRHRVPLRAMRPAIGALALLGALSCARGGPGAPTPGFESGVVPQPGPYERPPEASGRLNDAPPGTISPAATFTSRVYDGLKFRYYVYVPLQYRPGHPAALMVFQDGTSVYLNIFRAPIVLDNLIAAGEIPVTIALFIDPGTPSGIYHSDREQALRSAEYDALDDRYARFLLDEIIPRAVLDRYDVVRDPDGWAIAGQSSGGIAAFTAAWQRPDRFHRVMTQNGSFVDIRGGGAYPELIRRSGRKPLRVYLLSGTHDLDNQYGSWLKANTAMAAALAERGYAYRFRTGEGAHFPPLQGMADFPAALRWLWNGYQPPRASGSR